MSNSAFAFSPCQVKVSTGPGQGSVARYDAEGVTANDQVGPARTNRGTFENDEVAKMQPPRMLRMAVGDFHIFLGRILYASVRRDRRALTPTPCCLIVFAASTVIWSSVASRFSTERS